MLHIDKIMKKKKIGVTDLAKLLKVNRMTIYYYLKQDEKNSVSQLKKIASALDCRLEDFFDESVSNEIACPKCGARLTLVEK